MRKLLLPTLLTLAVATGTPAWAADDEGEDLDSSTKKRDRPKSVDEEEEEEGGNDRKRRDKDEVVREIERGFYAKANVGTTLYFLTYGSVPGLGSILRPGTTLSLSVGDDFVDRERSSMAFEFTFMEGVHNGAHFIDQANFGVPASRNIQGDTRTFSILVNYEYSAYPARRFGLGFRAGGGIMFSPLIMKRDRYVDDVVHGEWNIDLEPAVHRLPHPVGFAGPTIEYYTKLSHFSVGLDVDATYAVFFDLGLNATGYLKYTF